MATQILNAGVIMSFLDNGNATSGCNASWNTIQFGTWGKLVVSGNSLTNKVASGDILSQQTHALSSVGLAAVRGRQAMKQWQSNVLTLSEGRRQKTKDALQEYERIQDTLDLNLALIEPFKSRWNVSSPPLMELGRDREWKTRTPAQISARDTRMQKELKAKEMRQEMQQFQESPTHVVASLLDYTPDRVEPQQGSCCLGGVKAATSQRRKRALTQPKVCMNETVLRAFIARIGKIAHKLKKPVEIVGKTGMIRKISFVPWKQSVMPVTQLAHMTPVRQMHKFGKCIRGNELTPFEYERNSNSSFRRTGISQFRDLPVTFNSDWLVSALLRQVNKKLIVQSHELAPGTSGFILKVKNLQGCFSEARDDLLIVRGNLEGKIYDARLRMNINQLCRITYYSDIMGQFWRGFETQYVQNRPETNAHTCKPDIDIHEVGQIAGMLGQLFFPSWKVNCLQCANDQVREPEVDRKSKARKRIASVTACVKKEHPQFQHVLTFLEFYDRHLSQGNENFEDFSEIQRKIGDDQTSPASHINYINKVLIKSANATTSELNEATKALLEVTRWYVNRTEMVKVGSVKTFRNRAASKAHFNYSLSCDNQLDKNGNFEWGERSYHAKRFFSNYFEVIEPGSGYGQYEVRRGPSGARKLAINNLIVKLDFKLLRHQMKGEYVKQFGVDKHCMSIHDGRYLYPCCCVTQDDGTPKLSEAIMPTKNHLVIGNTGDSKYVDLPAEPQRRLYIAKEGYCYVNIFFAMLVNVDEGKAKDFTKRIRDTIIPKLGKWPTILDLASACYYMTIWHPDTITAELPRILVDHENHTLHVVDSYGSIDSGFHILKANTVSQLIMFANDEMQSEMKLYRVGGIVSPQNSCFSVMKLLIKNVYKPNVLKEMLIEDPFIVMLAIISPSVLLALFNSGSLEVAMNLWIERDVAVSVCFATMESLAVEMTRAHLMLEQFEAIKRYSSSMQDNIRRSTIFSESKPLVQLELEVLTQRANTDLNLDALGFFKYDNAILELLEKKFVVELEEAWQELSWWEKFHICYVCTKRSKVSTQRLHLKKSVDQGGRYDLSLSAYSEYLRKRCVFAQDTVKNAVTHCKQCFTTRCVNVVMYIINKSTRDILHTINILVVVSITLQISRHLRAMVMEHHRYKEQAAKLKQKEDFRRLMVIYRSLATELGMKPTREELLERVNSIDPSLSIYIFEVVEHESKGLCEVRLEQSIAIVTLLAMIFDQERSDAIYKILNKIRTLIMTTEQNVRHESLDEICLEEDEKKLTVDFDLESDMHANPITFDCTFEGWWVNQLTQNRVVPHYRTGGTFKEFTRATCVRLSTEIMRDTINKEFLIRGAVGSGKSTALPFQLARSGKVLLLEPTRPLAENVYKQLSSDVFNASPTLRMRGLSMFGSGNIDVMTSGYAFHYLANNPLSLEEYNCVMFDECHVLDASAMAFYCLLKEYVFPGKILKVSATPPGRECEFQTQFPVEIATEDTLTFNNFISAQGTGSNADVVRRGNNILVYVASYNEVDELSSGLIRHGYKVTKVDGRTMKVGSTTIETKGTDTEKHFIVATNIIENGVTLDVDVVVDFGLKVVAELDVDNRMMQYSKKPISYGERIQRLGRVGRIKPGMALRIGHTEKGLVEIPATIATEAAFLCFTHGLPVMTQNTTTNLLRGCTVKQAQTMQNFELSSFLMHELVKFDGSMHPEIHKLLIHYKLRDSEMVLHKSAIPHAGISRWIQADAYKRMGARNDLAPGTRIPFYLNSVPDRLYEQIWKVVQDFAPDVGMGRMSSASACKVSYTLKTDIHSLPRTLAIIDGLIVDEQTKANYFKTQMSNLTPSSSFSLGGIMNIIRRKCMYDHSGENLMKLQQARAQIIEFANLGIDPNAIELIQNFGFLTSVQHQSGNQVSKELKLRGKWHAPLITKDIFIVVLVAFGGCVLLYQKFMGEITCKVRHQAANKRQRQKLKFRDAHDRKLGREIYGNDETLSHYFGEAYTKRGKKSGRTHGMGKKTRNFVNFYGFDPTEYELIRVVDPLTGLTRDMHTAGDLGLIQEELGEVRGDFVMNDELSKDFIRANPGVHAYFIKHGSQTALKVDLSPHNPLLVCKSGTTLSGFPEREGYLRQTGPHKVIASAEVPKQKEDLGVTHEGKSVARGMRDYSAVTKSICKVTNESNGSVQTLYGLGFGSFLITNRHLFRKNNGTVLIQSYHGEFKVPNSTSLQMHPVQDRDLLIIKLPKDFPPFPQRLKFRNPESGERVCLLGTIFQTGSLTPTVSESSATFQSQGSQFWKHWISTKDGHCGLPMVSTHDGCIVGLHSLTMTDGSYNLHTSFPPNFSEKYLSTCEALEWSRKWVYNPNGISWGGLSLVENQPSGLFVTQKHVHPLDGECVREQSSFGSGWLRKELFGNLRAVATCENQLVTKHVVKGKCQLFDLYLSTHEEAKAYFKPLMGFYEKSNLNKAAYVKDVMKYSSEIQVGVVDSVLFEKAVEAVVNMLENLGFVETVYVTDEDDIFNALNMKAAVGALYTGKKAKYFEHYTQEDKSNIVKQSCERLFLGKMGVWNGSLKAELRTKEKVQMNKTRSFTAAPIETLLAGKVCVDDFNNQFYSLHLRGPWTVGITKFYGGWDKLLNSLPSNWIYCDADGSQFDSSLSPYLINAVLQIRLAFMEEWDIGAQMLRNLYTEIIYTPIATPDGSVVKKFKGNNSGQPSTVVDNTLMVIIAMEYALLNLNESDSTHETFIKYFVNGDDLMIAVAPEKEFILDTLSERFAELGLNYTFDTRTKCKEELWFMSHRGIMREGMYIPKLKKERIVSILEWDRSVEPEHRLEAVCASMIEAWGYDDLLHQIRLFYSWLLEQAPFNQLASEGRAPYIAETALKKLYLDTDVENTELEIYYKAIFEKLNERAEFQASNVVCYVMHQSGDEETQNLDAGDETNISKQKTSKNKESDRDVAAGTSGVFSIPRLKKITDKMRLPMVRGKVILNPGHLIEYTPNQVDLSNTRATQTQFENWYTGVKEEYGVSETEMELIMNGFMVWCIENGTSPNVEGVWVMMEGSEQIEYPLKPMVEHAKPTLRQIMAHFSNVAEAYIEMRNAKEPYMPRYGRQRNLRDQSLARVAFDFYEVTSKTSNKAREAHIQMKAAALRGANIKTFGLDGKVGEQEEDTERHTVDDVNRDMHSLLGVRQ
ncbi:polyprotein [Clivia yellow stripe virus]|uniref:Genome polyprotein n=1 Tax=Clivia yellow stripe virus TaxID=2838134 RepID=A0A8E7NG60_9POTV|nr:polyprotein [Clivia yellow stripe virus]QVY19271.1 polyprotein [Clivia yellow stripe virus]QVY19272.1 polyprotein [Clivia yellow stripe virus]